jgi:hypothetical protein
MRCVNRAEFLGGGASELSVAILGGYEKPGSKERQKHHEHHGHLEQREAVRRLDTFHKSLLKDL